MKEPAVGDRLDQYELVELLARSGMASIFKAVDHDSGAIVALKIPHMQFESDVVFYERFKREEQIGQRLDHPGIIKALVPRSKSRMYMAMEYIDGRSLRAVLDEQSRQETPRALDLAAQICEALVYLHSQRLVHRDLKPENVLVTPEGKTKLFDFGITLDESARRLTWVGLSATVGTPNYIAPEQIGGRRGDARSDIYALGTMLYEMLTGDLPFAAANAQSLMRAKTRDQPRPPSYHVPGFDPLLEAIIMKAIATDPRDRFATAAEFLVYLRDPAQAPPLDLEAARGRASGLHLSRRVVARLILVATLVGLGALVWMSSDHGAAPLPTERQLLPAPGGGR